MIRIVDDGCDSVPHASTPISRDLGLEPHPFTSSALARSALSRVLGVTGVIVLLWAAMAWAVALP